MRAAHSGQYLARLEPGVNSALHTACLLYTSLGELIIDVLILDGAGVVVGLHPASAILKHPLHGDGPVSYTHLRLPDAPSADTSLRDVFEDLYAFLLDDLAVIVRKFKQIPVPGGRNGVPAIGRQILFRDLPTFQRLASHLVISGKADPCTVFPDVYKRQPPPIVPAERSRPASGSTA